MDLLQALNDLPLLVAEYKQASAELAAVKRELETLKADKYVTYEWVCEFFDVSRPTAMQMLQDEKIFAHGRQIKRFRKSAILAFAERHSLKVKHLTE